MEAGGFARAERGWGYSSPAVVGAVLATLFFPLVSLIAALVLLGGQKDPQKRGALRAWAWVSGGWIIVQVILVIALSTAVFSGSSGSGVERTGPCVGGPAPNAEGKDVGDGKRFVFPCTFGGTETVSLP
jgi:hypothetical protein